MPQVGVVHRINLWRRIVLLALLVMLGGCGNPNDQSFFNSETGRHIDGWYIGHRSAFMVNCTACSDCHGDNLAGGIAGVSCFAGSTNGLTCHAGGFTGHPMPYASADLHGSAAKGVPACGAGFSYCQICHGVNFSGGTSGTSCLSSCHTINAPHSPAPWRSGARRHTNTNSANAPVCGLCHLGDPSNPVYSPLPPGAQPGCFSNTLCHGDED